MMSLKQAEKIYARAARRWRRELAAVMSASLSGEGWRGGVLDILYDARSRASMQLRTVSGRYIEEGKREPLEEIPF